MTTAVDVIVESPHAASYLQSVADETVVYDPVSDPDDELAVIRAALDDEYEIVEELGRGGMAIVYRARERALDRDVAIKVLPLGRTTDGGLVERFRREARLAAGLEHPNIVPVYRVGQRGRVSFLAMKHVAGPSLAQAIRERGPLPADEVRRLLLEVSEALDHAHARSLVHRDIKPDNVMIDEGGRFVVVDFGIARPLGTDRLTRDGSSYGTPTYMSPEQARGAADLDGRSDYYSLGAVAYEALTGWPPFQGSDPLSVLYAHVHDAPPIPAVPAEARATLDVLLRLLAKEPTERISSAEELRAALSDGETERLGAGSGGRRPPVSPPFAGEPRPRNTSSDLASGAWTARLPARLRARSSRFALAAGALFVIAVAVRDPAARRCRAALDGRSDDARAVLLDPVGTVSRGTDIDLAYVACNVPDDEPFDVQVAIRPADGGGVVGGVRRFFGGGGNAVRVSWDDVSDGYATERERSVVPPDLDPASYRATLRIVGADGRDAEASVDFIVVD